MINTRAHLHKIIDLSLPGAEVGSASGVFALEILSWGISKLYMIDIWEHMPNIKGMAGEPQKEHDYGDQNYGVKRAAQRFCNGKYKIHELIEDGKIENIGAYFINK